MRDLIFEQVSVSYGRIAALSDVSFQCAAGRVTCLVGPNGAGKSTALAAAAGMVPTHAGRILVGSCEVSPHAPVVGRSYLPQNGTFSKLLTVREVLSFAVTLAGASQSQCNCALEVSGLREVFNRRIGELSGGWERRVGLAYAIVQPADVLLLDEPLVGLDPETLDRVVGHLARRADEGCTIAMATHDFEAMDSLRPAIVVLDAGRSIARIERGGSALRDVYRAALMRAQGVSNVSAG